MTRIASVDQRLTQTEGKRQGRYGHSDATMLLLDFLHEGDTLVVTRIDRLSRGVQEYARRINRASDTRTESFKSIRIELPTPFFVRLRHPQSMTTPPAA